MKSIKLIACTIALFLLVSNTQAQKFGFLNSAGILSEVPEVKQAESNLKAYQEQLSKQGQQKVEALQAKYTELARKEKQGEIAPKALQEQAEKLKVEEEELAKLEQEMQNQLGQKREALLQPILDKINKAITDVAKEQGFSYIFDSSAGILLYADEASDVSTLVRTKLGLPNPADTAKKDPAQGGATNTSTKNEPAPKKQ
ncbi:MAG: OmpH family outer membrane protein [Bacteroidota bacterium]|nr:OmpH family outer membrane protein [Saprospiraceae bacterium]MDZ4807271.1 OmpH family outer membrane protein [Bacteroidota bacterium]